MTGHDISATRPTKNILVVEDERVVARDLQRNLADLGYSVPATAATAEQALHLASENHPDLVLMDIRIKGSRDGIETASLLKKLYDVPIVYITAYADPSTIMRAKHTEPFGYLLKPVKTNELRSAVEIALFKHDLERQLRDRERWLATMMQSLGDAIISTDASGYINYMNPAAERLTGWAAEDARGRLSDEILHLVDDGGNPVPNPLPVVLSQGRTLRVDAVLVRGDGESRIISDSTAPVMGDDGVVMGAVMVFRDVSERRQIQRQLEAAERLATVGTMAAGDRPRGEQPAVVHPREHQHDPRGAPGASKCPRRQERRQERPRLDGRARRRPGRCRGGGGPRRQDRTRLDDLHAA